MRASRFFVVGRWGLMLWLAFAPLSARPVNHYLRADATGANNGASWEDAWISFGAMNSDDWVRGDTYFVAGGNYNEDVVIPAKTGTGWIIIRKANSDDNSGDDNWNFSYASTPAVINGKMSISAGQVTLDGVTGSGATGHGIKINSTTSVNVLTLGSTDGLYRIYHLELKGPGFAFGDVAADGLYFNGNSKNLHVSNCYIHEIPRNGVTVGTLIGTSYSDYGMLYEKNVMEATGGVGIAHPDIHGQGMQIAYSAADSYLIIRDNIFKNIFGQGPISFLGGGASHSNGRIYNNIFYSTDPSVYTWASAIYFHGSSTAVSNFYIHNNTFYNSGGYSAYIRDDFASFSNVVVKNNLWVGCTFGNHHTGVTETSNNDYYQCTGTNVPSGETDQKTEIADPFVNATGGVFALVSGANAVNGGLDLSSDLGCTTGTDCYDYSDQLREAVWDIGAFEYQTGAVYPVLSVSKSGAGSGTVTSAPGGINCGTTCSASYTTGTVVALTAAPSGGSAFSGWSGACTGAATCVVTMDTTTSVTATFTSSGSSSCQSASHDVGALGLWLLLWLLGPTRFRKPRK